MAVPPIPEQEIAKLVLGYLAKEQLWTAYDEFLQSSPYLDALKNEYERIFMASLQQILSDYRTVSILVEKCQPLLLRRRLMQFTNLTDTVTFLINNIDQQKIAKPYVVRTSYPRECHQCKSNSMNCFCKTNDSVQVSNLSNSQNMVETTTFADLPGNHSTSIKKKCIKTIPRNATELTFDHFANDDSGHVLGLQSDDKDPNYDGPLCQENNSSGRSMRIVEDNSTNSMLKFDSHHAVSAQDHDDTDGYQMKIVPEWNENPTLNKIQNNIITTPRSTLQKKNRKSSLITSTSEIKSKTSVNSVQILSNVIVDQDMPLKKMDVPDVIHNSKTVQSMMTINGSMAYKSDNCGMFPKVDIMNMPTILVVPGSGTSQIPLQSESQKILYTNALSDSFGPLTIDISSEDSAPISSTTTDKNDLVSILDKNASAPKDNIVSLLGKSTPQFLPPTRKSSSTPRRSSHIRVLDFTTPRRILSETKENVTSRIESIEVIVSKSPERKEKESLANTNKDNNSTKENVSGSKSKKKNWDDDLRALCLNSQNESAKQPKSSSKSSKKKTEKEPKVDKTKSKKSDNKVTKEKTKSSRKRKSNTKESKDKDKSEVNVERQIDYVPQNTIKPHIKVVSDWVSPPKENNKTNAATNDLENDTPEMDRISLQNAIGTELNISDLLETPFKQALYDIQMETPRFLQPDIPCEPISDIKITDIPTPRFFNPNLSQATPNSYTSRPTDYSSGGSYYKPDEQDYVLPEFDKPSSSKNGVRTPKESSNKEKSNKDKSSEKPTRPVRQCTKNVSYCKTKNKPEIQGSSSSDSSADESMDLNVSDNSKSDNNTSMTNKAKSKPKTERKSTNVKKTPLSLKKSPKKFMKIRPRQTPLSARSKARQVPSRRGSLKLSPKHKSVINKTSPGNLLAAPTKSRRKSSTPRKVHTADSSKIISLDNNKEKEMPKFTVSCVPGSDSDFPLRWSEDITTDKQVNYKLSISLNESDDIGKIKEYIEKAADDTIVKSNIKIPEDNGSLHIDLIKRGFDVETAKSIERDLLDPGASNHDRVPKTSKTIQIETTNVINKDIVEPVQKKAEKTENIQPTQDESESEDDEIDLSVHDCNEESRNYKSIVYDENSSNENIQIVNLKETYSMEICLDDEVIRLRATNFASIFEFTPQETDVNDSVAETEAAVRSLRNIFTPSKDAKAQCLEIFDSTLTSLDTPLKSPKKCQATVTELVSEAISKEKGKKRKRGTSGGGDEDSENKKKRGTCYIANIKDMDIESVLSKLHGP